MKKTLLALCLLGIASTGHAAMITFVGEVADRSCKIEVNDNSIDPLVMLPTAATTDLPNVGDVWGKTDYLVRIFDCSSDPDRAGILLGPNSVSDFGWLRNAEPVATSATNVEIRLLDLVGAPISFTSQRTAGISEPWVAGDTEKTLKLAAEYIRTGTPVGLGRITSKVQYAVTYK